LKNGDLETLLDLINSDVRICLNVKDQDGLTPLHYACKQGLLNIVKAIVETGRCNFNEIDVEANTALMVAIINNEEEIAKHLIDHVSLGVKQMETGRNALHLACEKGLLGTAKAILENPRSNVNKKDVFGNTALMVAIINNEEEIAKHLIERNVSLVVKQKETGRNALHLACAEGLLETVTEIVKTKRVDLHQIDGQGRSALMLAKNGKHDNVVNYLNEVTKKTLPVEQCIICYNKPEQKAAFIPCGHSSFCSDCAYKFLSKPCPLCRTHVTQMLKLY
jgi:ankyrin repeat protein